MTWHWFDWFLLYGFMFALVMFFIHDAVTAWDEAQERDGGPL